MNQLPDSAITPSMRERFGLIASRISAPLRIAALLISVISMHILVVRPLVHRVDLLQSELKHVGRTMQQVAGQNQSIDGANDLLSGLRLQHENLASARATVRQLGQLSKEINQQAERIPEAIESVSRMSELPNHVFTSEAQRQSLIVPHEQPDPIKSQRSFPLLAESLPTEPEQSRESRSQAPVPALIRINNEAAHIEENSVGDLQKNWGITIRPETGDNLVERTVPQKAPKRTAAQQSRQIR